MTSPPSSLDPPCNSDLEQRGWGAGGGELLSCDQAHLPPCCTGVGHRVLTECLRLRTACRLSRLFARPVPGCSTQHELTAPSTHSTWEPPMREPRCGGFPQGAAPMSAALSCGVWGCWGCVAHTPRVGWAVPTRLPRFTWFHSHCLHPYFCWSTGSTCPHLWPEFCGRRGHSPHGASLTTLGSNPGYPGRASPRRPGLQLPHPLDGRNDTDITESL